MLARLCDECGKPASHTTILATGRVIIDGQDAGQTADLCEEHCPDGFPSQPKNCVRVSFYWPGIKAIK